MTIDTTKQNYPQLTDTWEEVYADMMLGNCERFEKRCPGNDCGVGQCVPCKKWNVRWLIERIEKLRKADHESL